MSAGNLRDGIIISGSKWTGEHGEKRPHLEVDSMRYALCILDDEPSDSWDIKICIIFAKM
jgi:hypothetical protein